MTTFEEIQPHQISLWLRVVLQSPNTLIPRQELCEMARPDAALIVQEDHIGDQWEESQRIQTLINGGPSSIFIVSPLLIKLRIPHEAEHITTNSIGS